MFDGTAYKTVDGIAYRMVDEIAWRDSGLGNV